MTNILQAIATIINNPIPDLLSHYRSQSKNRINAVGDALEEFVKDAFANTIYEANLSKKNEIYREKFSWTGNQNNPPDLIIRDGDAIEVKKIQSLKSQIALNSSYPKSKLFSDSPMITSACRNCRVIIVGYHEKVNGAFEFPKKTNPGLTLRNAIYDLRLREPLKIKDKIEEKNNEIPNHEYLDAGFSSIYMSRNRVRNWSEPSFTIQAGGRHAPIHPQANKMIFVEKDKRIFDPKSPKPYRRLSVRECARIQTFPDNFIFKYDYIAHGYKMVGNAVPVNFARILASKILVDIQEYLDSGFCSNLRKLQYAEQLTLPSPDYANP